LGCRFVLPHRRIAAATAAHADGVKCSGVNACKGQSACKGQGWTETTDVASCTAQGGKVL
jgi:hypothetical protein